MVNFSVMLSTYNGEKYLREQLDSILAQKGVALTLYIRDDGSSDKTVPIVREYMEQYNNIVLFEGENLGYAASFMDLVQKAGCKENMFYAFADQDDYWLENKLLAAAEKITAEQTDEPVLYYSDLKVVDENLQFIRMANNWEGRFDKFTALMFIAVRGCTVVYNDALQKLLTSRPPVYVSSHDCSAALVAFWCGRVVYDENAYILYRQTGNNVSITGTGRTDAFKKNVYYFKERLFGSKMCQRERNAQSLLECYGGYIKEPALVERVANYRKSFHNKRQLLKDKRYFRFHFSINAANVILILAGRL